MFFFFIISHFIFLILKKSIAMTYRNLTCFHFIIHSKHIMCGFVILYIMPIVLFARCIWDIIGGVKRMSMDLWNTILQCNVNWLLLVILRIQRFFPYIYTLYTDYIGGGQWDNVSKIYNFSTKFVSRNLNEEVEDTKEVIIILNSKMERQQNGQKEKYKTVHR